MKTTFACVALAAVLGIGMLLLAEGGQAPTQPQRLMGLGDLPGGTSDSVAYGMSADGSVVIGHSNSRAGMEAFRWTRGGGIEGLGFAQAFAVSADGSTIVGYQRVAGGCEPIAWTSSGLRRMGIFASFDEDRCGEALGVSADGSTVVGAHSLNWDQRDEVPFRWTDQSGVVALELAAKLAFRGQPRCVSADGSVVVGWVNRDSQRREAFRWTEGTGVEGLGVLPGDIHSAAHAVSADGSVVVGWSESIGTEAFRWTEASGMQSLGRMPRGSCNSRALAASADDSNTVGQAHGESGLEAFVWNAEYGMRSLREVLINEFASTPQLRGWQLQSATAVSTDGSTIVGYGFNPHGNRGAWIAYLGEPSSRDPDLPTSEDNRLASLR